VLFVQFCIHNDMDSVKLRCGNHWAVKGYQLKSTNGILKAEDSHSLFLKQSEYICLPDQLCSDSPCRHERSYCSNGCCLPCIWILTCVACRAVESESESWGRSRKEF
jgi:hypothetical protein